MSLPSKVAESIARPPSPVRISFVKSEACSSKTSVRSAVDICLYHGLQLVGGGFDDDIRN